MGLIDTALVKAESLYQELYAQGADERTLKAVGMKVIMLRSPRDWSKCERCGGIGHVNYFCNPPCKLDSWGHWHPANCPDCNPEGPFAQ